MKTDLQRLLSGSGVVLADAAADLRGLARVQYAPYQLSAARRTEARADPDLAALSVRARALRDEIRTRYTTVLAAQDDGDPMAAEYDALLTEMTVLRRCAYKNALAQDITNHSSALINIALADAEKSALGLLPVDSEEPSDLPLVDGAPEPSGDGLPNGVLLRPEAAHIGLPKGVPDSTAVALRGKLDKIGAVPNPITDPLATLKQSMTEGATLSRAEIVQLLNVAKPLSGVGDRYPGEELAEDGSCRTCGRIWTPADTLRQKADHAHSCMRGSLKLQVLSAFSAVGASNGNLDGQGGQPSPMLGCEAAHFVDVSALAAHLHSHSTSVFCAVEVESGTTCGFKFHPFEAFGIHLETAHGYLVLPDESSLPVNVDYCTRCSDWMAGSAKIHDHNEKHVDEIYQWMEMDPRALGHDEASPALDRDHDLFCPFCNTSPDLPAHERARQYVNRDTLLRHVNTHLINALKGKSVPCPYPTCAGRQFPPTELPDHLILDHGLRLAGVAGAGSQASVLTHGDLSLLKLSEASKRKVLPAPCGPKRLSEALATRDNDSLKRICRRMHIPIQHNPPGKGRRYRRRGDLIVDIVGRAKDEDVAQYISDEEDVADELKALTKRQRKGIQLARQYQTVPSPPSHNPDRGMLTTLSQPSASTSSAGRTSYDNNNNRYLSSPNRQSTLASAEAGPSRASNLQWQDFPAFSSGALPPTPSYPLGMWPNYELGDSPSTPSYPLGTWPNYELGAADLSVFSPSVGLTKADYDAGAAAPGVSSEPAGTSDAARLTSSTTRKFSADEVESLQKKRNAELRSLCRELSINVYADRGCNFANRTTLINRILAEVAPDALAPDLHSVAWYMRLNLTQLRQEARRRHIRISQDDGHTPANREQLAKRLAASHLPQQETARSGATADLKKRGVDSLRVLCKLNGVRSTGENGKNVAKKHILADRLAKKYADDPSAFAWGDDE